MFSEYKQGIYKVSGIDRNTLDLDKTLDCGQCFRWTKLPDGSWFGIVRDRLLMVKNIIDEEGNEAIITTATQSEWESLWSTYFGLDTDYTKGLNIPTNDEFALAAFNFGRGIRILKQDPWESLVSFIISQRNNIPKIKTTIERMCNKFGNPINIQVNGVEYSKNTFPTPDKIIEVGLQDLGLGYRDEYILRAAKEVQSNRLSLSKLNDKNTPSESVIQRLESLHGVGPKVANCVALFGLNRLDRFPIDVWMQRIIDNYYNGALNPDIYGGLAGLMQQYMFYYIKNKGG